MKRTTYPLHPGRNGWSAMLPARIPRSPLQGDVRADHVIVGAGYTGVAMARRLAEMRPDARILLLEADEVGEGSAGRNSGFTAGLSIPADVTAAAGDAVRGQNALLSAAWADLCQLMQEHSIDCQVQSCGTLRGAATEAGEARLRHVSASARAHGFDHKVLDRAEIRRRTGSDCYRFGIWSPDTCLVQPAALIRGLADSLPPNVIVHERTPVTSIGRDGDGWRLVTANGTVRADQVGLANNAFIRAFGYLRLRMAAIHTCAAVTAPVAETDLPALGEAPAWGLLPCHRLGSTLRRIGRDRLMVRSLYALEHPVPEERMQSLLRIRFERRWPMLRHVPFEFVWGGTTAFTMNGAPWWGELAPGLLASGGCNGSGIAKGTVLGRHLADLMLGLGDHAGIRQHFGTASLLPPDPFRTVGFHAISAIEQRKAGLES